MVHLSKDATVTWDDVQRDAKGHILPGSPRPPRDSSPKYGKILRKELKGTYTPARVIAMIEATWESAVRRDSPKSMVAVIELIVAYTMGKPAQRIELDNDGLSALGDILRASAPLLPERDVGARLTVIEPDGHGLAKIAMREDDLEGETEGGGGDGDSREQGDDKDRTTSEEHNNKD